jgi:hypothetical protein
MSKTHRKTCMHCGTQYRSNTESVTCGAIDCEKKESEKYDEIDNEDEYYEKQSIDS